MNKETFSPIPILGAIKMSSNGSTQPNIIQSVCDFIFYIIWVNITIAITIIMAFSINVASVIGNFSAVPRQAQRIDFFIQKRFSNTNRCNT